jgi:hypothetical protein
MEVMRLIYASRPFGFDDLALAGILAVARANNARDGITGALICREDLYLQLLEGPAEAVIAAFDRILKDDRHTEINTLTKINVDDRLFANWAMRHDPARSWMWTASQVIDGAVTRASDREILEIFNRLSKEPAHEPQM